MTKRWERWLPIWLAALAGTLAVAPAMVFGIPSNNDLANHYHFALPFYEAIAGGDLYPGWLASSNQGYGDPLFRFYPPALYYLLVVGRALTGDWYLASLGVFTFLSILGALGAFFWASSFLPRHIAAWAGVFYAFMPYRVAEIYQAAQLAEFAAGAALLFALAFTKRICGVRGQAQRDTALRVRRTLVTRLLFGLSSSNTGNKLKFVGQRFPERHPRFVLPSHAKYVCGLAVSYAALILTHLPLAVFGSISLLVYALLSFERNRKRKTILELATGIGLGLLACAFYWTTVVAEMKWIVGDGAQPDPLLDYRANFIFSTFSPEKNVTVWWMNILLLITLTMCLPALVLLFRDLIKRSSQTSRNLLPVTFLLGFTLLMTTELSKPLWAIIPPLQMAQHPFRWLAVTSLVTPVLLAASLPLWVKWYRSKHRPIALALAGLVLIGITFTLSQIIRPARYLSRTEFAQTIEPLKESPSIVQWLPVWASTVASGKASYDKIPSLRNSAAVEAGSRNVKELSWQALTRSFQVDAGEAVEARIRTLYYPHWKATMGERQLPTRAGNDGALLIALPGQGATVSLEFREPALSRVSVMASIICWTLMATLFIFGFRREVAR